MKEIGKSRFARTPYDARDSRYKLVKKAGWVLEPVGLVQVSGTSSLRGGTHGT